MKISVDYLNIRIAFYIACANLAGALMIDINRFRTVRVQLYCKLLYVENYLGYVFLYTGYGRKFKQYSVNLD